MPERDTPHHEAMDEPYFAYYNIHTAAFPGERSEATSRLHRFQSRPHCYFSVSRPEPSASAAGAFGGCIHGMSAARPDSVA